MRIVEYDFVGYGSVVELAGGRDCLYLDVGNQLAPGVVDHHHLPAYTGSAAGLVLVHPELVQAALNPGRQEDDPFTIVLHKDPDMDCMISAWLSLRLLSPAGLPPGADMLARYADRIDQGHPGMSLSQPHTLYAACMFIAHRLSQRNWKNEVQQWTGRVRECLEVIDFVMEKVGSGDVSLYEVNAFECPGLFSRSDRMEIQRDRDRYGLKLADPAGKTQRISLRLPGQFGGGVEVDTLLVRHVQDADDPERVLFFKDWARGDTERSPHRKGFEALSVFGHADVADRNRCILSVTPQCGTSLRGLGATLDKLEAKARIHRMGVDDRVVDPTTHARLEPRPGYDNADPWYDGRAHAFTIVDSPRSGSLLTADEVEEALVSFGKQTKAGLEPLTVFSRSDDASSPEDRMEKIRQTANLIAAWKQDHVSALTLKPDVFISYSHRTSDWVKEHIYDVLCALVGPDKIFFDVECLQGGIGWLAKLSDVVNSCRLFIPVYGPDYFGSDFCQWELMQAIVRDPTGQRRIVLPVMMQETALPNYCALIQSLSAERPDFREQFMAIVKGVLGCGG